MIAEVKTKLKSLVPVSLDKLSKAELKAYFENSWELYEMLFASIKTDETLNLQFGSLTPVGYMKETYNPYGFYDLFGNVWDWLSDDFYPLSGFEVHPLYKDFSAPYMDEEQSILLGGAWATTGTGASKYYRLWFRRHFFQHDGFRLAKSI